MNGKNEAKILEAVWGPLNETIITANEDGTIRSYDPRVRTTISYSTIIRMIVIPMTILITINNSSFVSISCSERYNWIVYGSDDIVN